MSAAIELAAEGGYDGVQMRDVASRAEVALGTLYHYFVGKDHLLAACLVEGLVDLEQQVRVNPAKGESNLDRILDLLRRTTGPMAENAHVTAAVIGGFVSEGPEVAECQRRLHEMFSQLLLTAFDDSIAIADQRRIARTLEHVWFSGLIGWKNGWMPLDQAISELEDSAVLLLST